MANFLKMAIALFLGTIIALSSAPVSASYQKGAQFYLKKEYKEAYGALLPAAEAGHALAQFMVAVMYDLGFHVKKDGKIAAEWYRKASEQGHPDAQLRFSRMLYDGVDVPLDREAAYKWAALAVSQMHGQKQENAAAFAQSVAALLNQKQLDRAKTAIAAWRPVILRPNGALSDQQRLLYTGTGFFLNTSGTLLTNQHVVYACQRIIASYGDQSMNGTLLDVDFGADLATVQINIKPSNFARFADEKRPAFGMPVTVTGYAIKQTLSRDPLTSSGTVSDASIALNNAAWFQTTTPIYRGQSGSPAFNAAGLVVGTVRGISQELPDNEQPKIADGQATVVGTDSIFRFLNRTKILFKKASSNYEAPAKTAAFPTDFIVLLECWGS